MKQIQPKKILVLNCNPARERTTLSASLVAAYVHHAEKAGHNVVSMRLAELAFDPIQHEGYTKEQPLEPDLVKLRDAMTAADHWVWVFPLWFGLPPALMKGFIERVLTKGYAFDYEGLYPVPLSFLKGKTVRIIITCGMPTFVYHWFSGEPTSKALRTVIKLCGMKVSGITVFGMIADHAPQAIKRYARYIESLRDIAMAAK